MSDQREQFPEHRHGGDRRRQPTRRDIDRRLLRVMIALAGVFLVIASVASIVALVNARNVQHNSDAIEANRVESQYERDVAKWHFDVSGCKQGTQIFRALIVRSRDDAAVLALNLTGEARNYFRKQIPRFNRQLAIYQTTLCDVRFPKPATPPGVEELK